MLALLRDLLLATSVNIIVLVTIRTNAYEPLQTAKALDGLHRLPFDLAPMPRGAYAGVIEGPAERLKSSSRPLRIEPAVTQALLHDVEAGARDWAANAEQDAWLAHTGARLEEAERVAAREEFSRFVEPTERAYLAACREREAARLRREHKLRRRFVGALLGLLVVIIAALAFSPDGSLVLTASHDATARLWDARNGKAIRTLQGHKGPVWSASFSPDGRRIVTASEDPTAHLWDTDSGAEVAVLRGHENSARRAVFSSDGKRIVTASKDKTARLWDALSGAQLGVYGGHADVLREAVFSPDGRHVATAADDGTARLWEVRTGAEIAVLRGHDGPLWSIAYSPSDMRSPCARRGPLSIEYYWK